MTGLDPVGLALWLVAFLVSATCHEAGHAFAAKLGGDATAYRAGQVTLNPVPHIRREPFGMVVIPLLSYAFSGFMIGWASAPYDPLWADRHPKRAGLMAAAGPAANLILALIALAGIRLLVQVGLGTAPDQASFERLVQITSGSSMLAAFGRFLSILAMLNAMLLVFNLMPVPPLDGASIVERLGGQTAARGMAMFRAMPMAGFVGILIAWQLFGYIAPLIFSGVLSLAHPGAVYH